MTLQEFIDTKFNEFTNHKHLFFIFKSPKYLEVFPVFISREDDTDDLAFLVVGDDDYLTKEELLRKIAYKLNEKNNLIVEKIITEKAFIEEYLEN